MNDEWMILFAIMLCTLVGGIFGFELGKTRALANVRGGDGGDAVVIYPDGRRDVFKGEPGQLGGRGGRGAIAIMKLEGKVATFEELGKAKENSK